mmetsp:Transcript_44486/g.70729  ORF Transcript_44486/g.70729 Transcript_44486/m.70729 type:complete len:199 (+) Transcript_44486:38-634(+)
MKTGDEKRRSIRHIHERFNLFMIPPLVLLTGCSLMRPSLVTHGILSWSVLSYMVLDTTYNLLAPDCQPTWKRWVTILLHHVTAAWLVCFPINHPDFAHLTAYCTTVEVNTLFLTLYKVFKWNFAQTGHMVSWVVLRLLWYPYLVYHFHEVVSGGGFKAGSYEHFQSVGSQVILCGLNFYWTFEVAMGMSKKKEAKLKD